MDTRSHRESRLLGIVFGLVMALAITVPVALLPIFDDDDPSPSSSSPETTTTVVAAPGAGNGNGGNGRGNGGGGNGQGNGRGGGGNGSGQGNGNGLGNGNGQGQDSADPLSQGVAREEVAAAFASGGCVACHNIKGIGGATARLGPSLSRAGFVASERRPGYEALEYLKESIADPEAFVRTNCPDGPCIEGLMPQTFGETLTTDEISTIVNYLAVLGTAAEADVLFDQ